MTASPASPAYFLRFYRSLKAPGAALLAFTGLRTVLLFLTPFANVYVFDHLIVTVDGWNFKVFALFLAAAVMLLAGAELASDLAVVRLRTKVTAAIRGDLVRRVTGYAYGFFLDNQPAKLVHKLIPETDTAAGVLVEALFLALSGIQLGLVLILVAFIDRHAFLLFAALALAYLAVSWLLYLPLDRATAGISAQVGNLYAKLYEVIPAIKQIKCYGLEGKVLETCEDMGHGVRRTGAKAAALGSLLQVATQGMEAALFMGLLVIGFLRLKAGTLTHGEFAALTGFSFLATSPLTQFAQSLSFIQTHFAVVRRLAEITGHPGEAGGSGKVERIEEGLRFSGVSFAYPGNPRPILRSLDLKVARGESVAIVGRTGCGKSTLASLLLGLHRGYTGEIHVDARELKTLDIVSLRRMIAVVSQDLFLFDASIRENIDPWGTLPEDELQAVCREARLEGLLRRTPGGLMARVGERAVRLSGGERQRIAFARALAKRARLIILDEATSAVDPETEADLRATLRTLRARKEGATLMTITHRASVAMDCDRILVLADGAIRESGTHSQLLALDGEYCRLFRESCDSLDNREDLEDHEDPVAERCHG